MPIDRRWEAKNVQFRGGFGATQITCLEIAKTTKARRHKGTKKSISKGFVLFRLEVRRTCRSSTHLIEQTCQVELAPPPFGNALN